MHKWNITIVAVLILAGCAANRRYVAQDGRTEPGEDGTLVVLWTSGDPEVANKVCFMYTQNAKKQKWFDEVTLVVWGPSSRLLASDKQLQKQVKEMMTDGVKVEACIVCANMYGVADRLREIGIEVKGMGQPLSDYLKNGCKVLTF